MYSLTPKKYYVKRRNDDFYNMRSLMNNLFDDSFWNVPSFNQTSFKLDIKDTEEAYLIEAELPGISKEDVSLEYNEERLHIEVKHEEDSEEKQDKFIHKERSVSSMSRTIYMPEVDAENIEAELKDGILRVRAAKLPEVDTSIKIDVK